jgi:hypothetical protein
MLFYIKNKLRNHLTTHLDMSLGSMLISFTFQPLQFKIDILTNAIIVWICSGF